MHVTIDLETLDVIPGATILTVGLVTFDPFSEEEPFNKVHLALEYEGQGRSTSPATEAWWYDQSDEAKSKAFTGERLPVKQALRIIQSYFKKVQPDKVWGQGYGFDMTMLEDMFRQNEMDIPWKFWQVRDSRTLYDVMPQDPRPKESFDSLHDAAADSYWQSIGIQKTVKVLTDAGLTPRF